VTVRWGEGKGKGKKDHVIPVGERAVAAAWLDKDLDQARPRLVTEPDRSTLFLTAQGEPFGPNRLSGLVRDSVKAAEIGEHGACHLFRHTMATLMLEGGAEIRFIQQMLGHARHDTTQIDRLSSEAPVLQGGDRESGCTALYFLSRIDHPSF
jgi:integrase/recombinase XerD